MGNGMSLFKRNGFLRKDTNNRVEPMENPNLDISIIESSRGADLRHAYLAGADFRDTDLSDADLSGAYLEGADFRGANLSDADLSGAYLEGADFRGANFSGNCDAFFKERR